MEYTTEPPYTTQRLVQLLAMLYSKYEEGTLCYEDPDVFDGFVGNAFYLTEEEETEILTLLDHFGIRTAVTQRDAEKQQ